MADEEKKGLADLFSKKKKKDKPEASEAKTMEEPEAKIMEEPEPEPANVVQDEKPAPKVEKPKRMIDSNPSQRRKYLSILDQKPAAARKYFRSK